jgi:TonB-dependent SusC/RagA subfamily outer membrane receptor
VTDGQTGDPLPGATVQVQELGIGSATDVDGNFEFDIPAGEHIISVSFVGYRPGQKTVTITVGETTGVDFALQPRTETLDEIVVTGQGSGISSRRLSTTTEVVDAEELEAFPVGRIDQALQSQLPNAQIRLNSGQPGTTSLIRSRGPVSASGVTTPVIYVDGVRVDNSSAGTALDIGTGGARSSSIADIPLENIERIEFVKGGAATTLYGSDAANGVLQIFTKDGSAERSQLNFETRLGVETGTRDFLKYERTGDVIYDDALVQSYKLSGSGGVGDINYSFSGKMYENNSARVGNENIRYDLRTKVSASPLDKVRYSGTLAFVNNRFDRAINANSSFSPFSNIEGGQLFSTPDGVGPISDVPASEFGAVRDSLRGLDQIYDNLTEVRRFQTSQQLQINPVSSVTIDASAGVDYRIENNKEILSNELLAELGSSGQSQIADYDREFLGLTLNANVNHEASYKFLDFTTNIGFQVFREEITITRIDATDVPDGNQTVNAGSETTGFDNITEIAQQGYYIKENVGFGDRLFLDLGLRADNNSAFGSDVALQVYPSAGLSYIVSDEPVIAEVLPEDVVSSIKLRGNYGVSGNFPAAFAGDRLINVNAFLGQTSYSFADPGDPNLGPERVTTWEVGGDLGFVNDRFRLGVTYYQAKTEDALFDAPFPSSTGQNNQVRNLGEIENKGFEIAGNFTILNQADYGLTLNASANTLTNEVISNGGTSQFNNGGFTFLGTFVDEGQPIGFLQGGNPIFNDDGTIAEIEQNAVLGDPNPDLFGSMSLQARYKGLSLFASADYQRGAQGVNVDDVLRFFSGVQDEDRFPNPEGLDTPPALAGDATFFDLAGVWVEDTDYLKVRLISLDYRIPASVLPSQLRSLSVGASVTNPLNFTSSSFDPEVSGSENAAGTVAGVFGFGTISPPRQWTLTLNVGL